MLAFVYLGIVAYAATRVQDGHTLVCHHTKVVSFITITAGFVVPTFLLLVVQLHNASAEKQRKSIFVSIMSLSDMKFL